MKSVILQFFSPIFLYIQLVNIFEGESIKDSVTHRVLLRQERKETRTLTK